MKRFRRAQLGAVIVIVLAACGNSGSKASSPTTLSRSSSSTAASVSGTPFEGTQWGLTDATNLGVPLTGVMVTAEFVSGRVTGAGGCNTYGAPYTLRGAKLTIGAVASTLIACAPGPTAVEQAYLSRLGRVESQRIAGTTLTLLDSNAKPVLVYTAVDGAKAIAGKWTVISYYSGNAVQSPEVGSTLTAEFDAGHISGSGGCNAFNGGYTLSGPTTIKIGPLASTQIACAPTRQTQEQQYLAALELATSYSVTPSVLTLFRPGGTIAATFTRG